MAEKRKRRESGSVGQMGIRDRRYMKEQRNNRTNVKYCGWGAINQVKSLSKG